MSTTALHPATPSKIACTLLCAAALSSALLSVAHADPVPLPDPKIPGYAFPQDEATLMKWVNNPGPGSQKNINLHGWGLWTSLTAPSGQREFGLPNAPVFLTWLTPEEIQQLPPSGTESPNKNKPARVLKLQAPRQLTHGAQGKAALLESAARRATTDGTPMGTRDTNVVVTVGYNPAAQAFAQQNNLFSLKALQAMAAAGKSSIPTFPNGAVTTKPVYKVVSKANMLQGTSIYVTTAWPGTPAVPLPASDQQGAYGETVWPGCIYIDASNAGTSKAKGIDADCSGPDPQSTYGLGDFISLPVTSDNVAQVTTLVEGQATVAAGDHVILMAMHVTSREISEWTWETFFWTPDASRPPTPSSRAVADARPAQLKGAAAHYAMSIAYQMVAPNQPVNGGRSVGAPVIAFNPYLEAGLPASSFGTPPPLNVGVKNLKTGKVFIGTQGVQTNCMSCHAAATIAAQGGQPLNYVTNFYFPRNDPAFNKTLQTDFLWSIPGVAK